MSDVADHPHPRHGPEALARLASACVERLQGEFELSDGRLDALQRGLAEALAVGVLLHEMALSIGVDRAALRSAEHVLRSTLALFTTLQRSELDVLQHLTAGGPAETLDRARVERVTELRGQASRALVQLHTALAAGYARHFDGTESS